MKLNKLEQDIKKKLNNRTIQPSENGWNKLDEMLSANESKKPTHRFYWLYIAASLTGIVFLGIYTIKQNTGIENMEPQLVVQETITIKDSIHTADKTTMEAVKDPVRHIKPATELAEIKTLKKQNINNNESILISNNEINNLENTSLVDINKLEKFTNQKSQISNNTEELLVSVENSATLPNNNSKIKVNASNLLSQIDTELEQTFKEKALQSITKNFNNLKTALASRNLEN